MCLLQNLCPVRITVQIVLHVKMDTMIVLCVTNGDMYLCFVHRQ